MDIHKRLAGKVVAEVVHNGQVLNIRTQDGGDVMIGWVNENGELVKGRPVVVQTGARLKVAGMRDLFNLPGLLAARGKA